MQVTAAATACHLCSQLMPLYTISSRKVIIDKKLSEPQMFSHSSVSRRKNTVYGAKVAWKQVKKKFQKPECVNIL